MQTVPDFNIMYESSVVIPSTLLAQQSKVKTVVQTFQVLQPQSGPLSNVYCETQLSY